MVNITVQRAFVFPSLSAGNEINLNNIPGTMIPFWVDLKDVI